VPALESGTRPSGLPAEAMMAKAGARAFGVEVSLASFDHGR